MTQRIITALSYTVVAVIAALQAGIPQTPEAWIGLVVLAITTFWGKFSSAQTILAMNRPVWSEEKRKVEAVKDLNA